jgi:antagonist of KipI
LLRFPIRLKGARAYLAVHGGLQIANWLGSNSTNLEAKAGGFEGRAFKKQDQLPIKNKRAFGHIIDRSVFQKLPWGAAIKEFYKAPPLRLLVGNEYYILTDQAKEQLEKNQFIILPDSNRMGYRLQSASLAVTAATSLISTAVTCGTVQLLPNGQLIILMSDHQTTGGYPRVAHVCVADMPALAQKNAGDAIQFKMISMAEAEEAMLLLERNLQQLENACNFRLQAFMNE